MSDPSTRTGGTPIKPQSRRSSPKQSPEHNKESQRLKTAGDSPKDDQNLTFGVEFEFVVPTTSGRIAYDEIAKGEVVEKGNIDDANPDDDDDEKEAKATQALVSDPYRGKRIVHNILSRPLQAQCVACGENYTYSPMLNDYDADKDPNYGDTHKRPNSNIRNLYEK
jgi:hypothetical protein